MAQEKRISDTPCSALEGYGEGPQRAANGQDSWGRFKDAQGLGRLDAGSRVGFLHQLQASTTMNLGIFNFSLFLCVSRD